MKFPRSQTDRGFLRALLASFVVSMCDETSKIHVNDREVRVSCVTKITYVLSFEETCVLHCVFHVIFAERSRSLKSTSSRSVFTNSFTLSSSMNLKTSTMPLIASSASYLLRSNKFTIRSRSTSEW